jgi:hypothetical protein
LAIDECRSFFRPLMWTGRKNDETHLEQIWIPGVHSDVGGAYTKRFLGNIALLTMIDRAIEKTPLSFDLEECAKYNVMPPASELVRIHNEYTRLWRLFCPFPQNRTIDTDFEQSIHPYAKWLIGRAVNYKTGANQSPYALQKYFEDLPEADEFISGKFGSFCQ